MATLPGIKHSLQLLLNILIAQSKKCFKRRILSYAFVAVAFTFFMQALAACYPYLYLYCSDIKIAGREMMLSDFPFSYIATFLLSLIIVYVACSMWRTNFWNNCVKNSRLNLKSQFKSMVHGLGRLMMVDLMLLMLFLLPTLGITYLTKTSAWWAILFLPLVVYLLTLSFECHENMIVKGLDYSLFKKKSFWLLRNRGTTFLVVYISFLFAMLPLLIFMLPMQTVFLSHIAALRGNLLIGDPIFLPKYFFIIEVLTYLCFGLAFAHLLNIPYLAYEVRMGRIKEEQHKKLVPISSLKR